jgi:hypothetical protein
MTGLMQSIQPPSAKDIPVPEEIQAELLRRYGWHQTNLGLGKSLDEAAQRQVVGL